MGKAVAGKRTYRTCPVDPKPTSAFTQSRHDYRLADMRAFGNPDFDIKAWGSDLHSHTPQLAQKAPRTPH